MSPIANRQSPIDAIVPFLFLLVASCANSPINTSLLTSQEKLSLSCQDIRTSIDNLRSYLSSSEDLISIASMFVDALLIT